MGKAISRVEAKVCTDAATGWGTAWGTWLMGGGGGALSTRASPNLGELLRTAPETQTTSSPAPSLRVSPQSARVCVAVPETFARDV